MPLTLHPPGIPVHFNTNSTSLESIQPCCNFSMTITRSHISTAARSQICSFTQLGELGRRGENKNACNCDCDIMYDFMRCLLYCPHVLLLDCFISECLFGQAPFASKSLVDLEKKIKDTRPIQVRSINSAN